MQPTPHTDAVRTAELLRLGVTRHALSGPLWRAPWRGVQVPAWAEVTPAVRIRAAALLLPDGGRTGAVGGWGAAHQLGADEIDGFADDGVTRLPVALYPVHRLRRRPGIELCRSVLAPEDVVDGGGVPVTSPVRTAFDLGRWSRDLRDAVVALDQAARCLDISVAEVREYVEERAGWRGTPLLRRALPLVNPRARSRPESRLRLVWLLDAHLPPPQVNPEVEDGRGRLLGLPDLLDPGTGLAGEYDGAQHRELEQHTKDNIREEAFERIGLTVVRATSKDLPGRLLVTRLRAGQADACRRPRGPWTSQERPLRR